MHFRILPPTRLARVPLLVAWVSAAWVGSRVCAAASCPVQFRGAPSKSWLRAGRAIEMLRTDSSDCAHLEIELERNSDAARLLFVTRDGRRAVRRLAHPDELMPTVVALGVRGVSEEKPKPVLEDAPTASERATDEMPLLASPPSEPGVTPEEARALFAVLGGVRAGAGRLVSPVLGGSAAVTIGLWELGINLALELQYFNLQQAVPQDPSSAVSVGVTVGRREAIADFELLFGARSMVAALNDESLVGSGERGRAELRLGAYLGGVWPRQQSSRYRADLTVDIVPHESLGAIGTPVTPWMAVSALFGVEFDGQ